MNPLFYPSNSKARESKSGLEKHRKIMHYTDAPSKGAIKDNIPDSWFYNDKNANKIWESLEVDPVVKFEPTKSIDNPFARIDESTTKIKQMIASYELTDQELLMHLMSILEQDDEFFGNYHDEDALFEAKLRLGSMINDHSGNSEAQEKMLDSLRAWFDSMMKKSQTEGDGELRNLKDTYNVDAGELADMINNSFENREMNSEQLQLLHRSVVDNLTRQIRDMRRKITEQEETIDELNKTIEQQKSFRKRQMLNLKKDEKDIMNYQRSICEKDARIIDLKSTINEIAVDAKSARQNPPTPPPTDEYQERNEEEITSSLEKDFELDYRIRTMSNTITSLRQELNDTVFQLRTEKQSNFALENKLQLLDRTKKSIEQTLLSTNERYALLEKKLKDKSDELEKVQKGFESSAVTEAVNETKKEYEEKIHNILDENRANVSKAVESVEKRYKKQIAELMKAVEVGETQTAIDELNTQHLNEISIIKKECNDELNNLRVMHGNRLHLLTKHYETKISQLLNDQKRIQESIEKDRDIYVEEKRIEIEEDFSRKMIDYQDQAATDLSDLKSRFEGKIGQLEEKLRNIESERDTLKNIIEENDLIDELPVNFSETSVDFNGDGDDDDVLADSILQMKKREIEKSVSEKYNALLKAQRESINDAKNWEIEQLKKSFQVELNENLYDLRHEIVDNLCQLKTLLTSNNDKNSDDVDESILSTLKLVQNHDLKVQEMVDRKLIPLNEVESRLSECNEKINDLSGENEFLRFTLKQLNNSKDLVGDNNEDLIRAMRTSISAQASQISQTLRDYEDMKARVEYYEQKEKDIQLSNQLVQTEQKINVFSPNSYLIFSRSETEELNFNRRFDQQKDDDDDEIILRDNSNRVRSQRSLHKNLKNDENDEENITKNDFVNTNVQHDDVSTQTELIPVQKSKKKVKKSKNSTSNNETESQSTTAPSAEAADNSENKNETHQQQQQNEETKPTTTTNTQTSSNENQNQNENKITKNQNDNENKAALNNDNLEEKEVQSLQSPKHKQNNKNEDEITKADLKENNKIDNSNNDKDNDNDYEYEYEDNYNDYVVRLTRLSFSNTKCIFQVVDTSTGPINGAPSATYSIDCPSCHRSLSFDPQISEVSSTIDPVIECPHCHSSVTIDREKYPVMFKDDNFSTRNSMPLTPEEKSQIAAMEESIHNQVQDLIKMKQKLRNEVVDDNSHFRDDLATSLPTAILTLPTNEKGNEKEEEKLKQNEKISSANLKVSLNSLAIEIPAFNVEFNSQSISSNSSRKLSPKQKSASTLSSRSFISKFDDNGSLSKSQEGQISNAEQKIDQEISKLIEYKQEILSKRNSSKESKRNSSKESKMNSDDNDENEAVTKPSIAGASRKLKLEEMPTNEDQNKSVIKNIATELQMTDLQLQRNPQNNPSIQQTASSPQPEPEPEPVISTEPGPVDTATSLAPNCSLKIQSSSNYIIPLKKTNLTISESILFGVNKVQKTVNEFLKSLAIQTVSEIDVSSENIQKEPIKQLETIEKAVLTLSNLNAFQSSDKNAILASSILQKAQSLKDIDPKMIPNDEVEEVVQSARKLLISFCKESELDQVNIKPLSAEAGGFLSDDVEKLRSENLKYKNEIMIIAEKQTKLKEEIQDLNESTKELKLKHEEIIFSLQKLIENIVKLIKNGEGKLDSNTLKTLKDQAQYLIGSIKEKENIEADNRETNQLLKERDVEIISLNHLVQKKEGQIEELASKLAELTAHIEKADLQAEGHISNVKSLEQLDKENRKVIDSMSETIFKMKDNSDQLQKKVDQLELVNEQLQNRIVMRESEFPVSYSFISPFVIFDTKLASEIPVKGFALVPGRNKHDQIATQNEQNGTEKIRVKHNQASKNGQSIVGGPKLIVPKTSQSRSRLGSNSKSSNTSSNRVQSNFGKAQKYNDSDYVDFFPVHGEDPKSFIYINQVRANNYGNGGNYFDRNPISGNVVLQKTVTNLNRRIFSLQNVLQAKSHEVLKLRDQKAESRQNLYKMTLQFQKSQKDLTRAKTILMLNEEKLAKAMNIIEQRDLEIKELRDLIRQLRAAAAQPALLHQVMSNIAEDQSNLAAMRAFRGQATIREIPNAYEINPALKRLAQRQMMVVKRWEKRRQDLVRQQQKHLLSVLAGMSLISTPSKIKKESSKADKNDLVDDEFVKKIAKKKNSVTVTSLEDAKKKKIKDQLKNNSTPVKKKTEPEFVESIYEKSEFDSSWKNANASTQKIPHGMKEGVVAQPL